jgi:hypothetical protein
VIQAITHPGTRPELLELVQKGLADGSLYQSGGVIRRALPEGARGQIFAHVYQLGTPDPSSASSVLGGLLKVSTGLSALNLGVSVAGFAYLAYRMNKLDQSVQALETTLRHGLSQLDEKLTHVDFKLNGLTTLALQGLVSTQALSSQLERVSRQLDWAVMSRMYASAESLSELERGQRRGVDAAAHAERIREVRVYLSGMVEQFLQDLANASLMDLLHLRLLLLALAQALAAESAAWRLDGETLTAAHVLAQNVPRFRQRVRELSGRLLGGELALLGASERRSWLIEKRSLGQVAAFLMEREASSPNEVTLKLALRWSEYLSENPARSRELLANREPLGRRLHAGLELAAPLIEAAQALEGAGLEYRALADGRVPREQWELSQHREGPAAVYVRPALSSATQYLLKEGITS